ncbi:ThiF family adenylyltransferase [Alteribacillus sp. HJP-4]|uniref:ThiF family adenylyltransferase n=1 Tax=Alteribacillus sp. HJP-4 TaxID=2775394 RepID=UPI0035CD0798
MNERYSRQLLFPGIGREGQRQINKSHAFILGVGALGSAIAETLVRAGIGRLTIVDRDYVEWSNLHRQQLYGEREAEESIPKAIAAKSRLSQINSETDIDALVMDAVAEDIDPYISQADVILDGTDNFDIRFILNDFSQKYEIPWIFGACAGSYGMSYTIMPPETPCLSCIMPAIPAESMTCETSGVIAPAIQATAAHQTTEALKILTGNTQSLRKKLVLFDMWQNQQQALDVQGIKKDGCPSCGSSADFPYLTSANEAKLEVLCGRETVQIRPASKKSYDFTSLEQKLKEYGAVKKNSYLLSCTTEEYRLAVFKDGRVLVHGTKEIEKAKSVYERFFA